MLDKVKEYAKKMWGADKSKGFKLAAWGIAFAAAGAWWYYDYMQKPPWMRSIEPSKGPYTPDSPPAAEKSAPEKTKK